MVSLVWAITTIGDLKHHTWMYGEGNPHFWVLSGRGNGRTFATKKTKILWHF
jgi:hypothetical protein